ncbi:MAG TPA: cysteine--tRNA ligase [Fimbriimonadaceae bacterium]|nr:cysteine--tRNA ligase [Fimbriimonadaceae bacterium]HRJ97796.1 cysteine--tRNA ligase [Fimbriimonadaceae bacterium]
MSQREFRLYDTLTRSVKPLVLAEPGHLRFYSCGPTVYSYAHIGNFRTFLTADLVVRTAQALGWRVSYVSNITDVGHLTSDDQDGGEDRMEKGLKSKEGEAFVNVWDLADYYADCFKEDWARLNLRRPLVWPRATQHMREQILAVEHLIERGNAYETPTGVYFSVASFPEYGKLSGNKDRENLFQAVRNVVQDDNKREPADFALWKKDDKHLMQWYSPWGWGFPGWHIECSVMAMQYLGETIDLHAGGEDLVFPHHECEVAQSECLTGKPFANHWIHTRFLQVDGAKMSKSLGNFFTVRDLVEGKGVDPLALRYALISVPYGKPLNFTMQTLRDATKNLERYRECERLAILALDRPDGADTIGAELDALFDATLDAMCDDLNTSVALAKALEGTGVVFRESASMGAASARSALRFLARIGDLLGFLVPRGDGPVETAAVAAFEDEPPALVIEMSERRLEAKRVKDFALADRLRLEIEEAGWEVRDTPEGPQFKRRMVPL